MDQTQTLQKAFRRTGAPLLGLLAVLACSVPQAHAQPVLADPGLTVRTLVDGLDTPTSMAFIGDDDILVLEKGSGRVRRILDGKLVPEPVLDLAVNSASERGLLGIAVHPRFPQQPAVYLYWTESTSGADSDILSETPLLGNRVDRFLWNGSTLTLDTNIIRLRALQADANQPERGNHNGGIIKFGPDGKLYIYIGDNGRRGQMQNLPDGPGPAGNMPDDQFGGPEPDNAHLTGVILRLNDDGSTPSSNPFFSAGASRGGEAGTNLQKVFAFGIRNGFGMAFDPNTGDLWEAQNGDDTFTELNRVEAGANLGWIQVMGPLERLDQFKAMETSTNFLGLQQVRWSPTNIADSAHEAIARMFMVFDGGNQFGAGLVGGQEVPPLTTAAAALVQLRINAQGLLAYELRAAGPIQDATQAHIHLGGRGQNGPVVAFLFQSAEPRDFAPGELIARGTLADSNVIARAGFTPSLTNLLSRMRQGRTYVNLHTVAHPGGEARGQLFVSDRAPVSRYSDPELSWKFEVAPAAVGFIEGGGLGKEYDGDIVMGAARTNLLHGQLFRIPLDGKTGAINFPDRRLQDGVADNLRKFDVTESESLLFGAGFGIGTDIETGPNGKLYVVSLSHGAIYEISREGKPGKPTKPGKPVKPGKPPKR